MKTILGLLNYKFYRLSVNHWVEQILHVQQKILTSPGIVHHHPNKKNKVGLHHNTQKAPQLDHLHN